MLAGGDTEDYTSDFKCERYLGGRNRNISAEKALGTSSGMLLCRQLCWGCLRFGDLENVWSPRLFARNERTHGKVHGVRHSWVTQPLPGLKWPLRTSIEGDLTGVPFAICYRKLLRVSDVLLFTERVVTHLAGSGTFFLIPSQETFKKPVIIIEETIFSLKTSRSSRPQTYPSTF